MRRPVILGVAFGAVLAVMPLASHAATVPSVSLLAPSSSHATGGDLVVRWSYSGFHRSTAVDIEASTGGEPFQRVARTVIDDGTPGYYGSHTVSTTSLPDATDYTIRVIVPTRRSVHSSVTPVTIDNTGPSSTVTAEPVTDPAPATSITADVEGTAADAVSNVASVAVTFVAGATETAGVVTCDCGGPTATWSASTDGLPPGAYTVEAVATDSLGNVGAAASADMVIVGTPNDPTPALVATVNGVIETATTAVGGVVETVTGTTVVEDTVETVTGTTVVTDAIATITGTTTVGEVVALTEDVGEGT